MDFYYEIDSWKDIPLNKTFALTEATSYTAAMNGFEKKEKRLPAFIVKEIGHQRYWMPASLDEWTDDELKTFVSILRKVDR